MTRLRALAARVPVRPLLVVAALGCFVVSAWLVAVPLGLLVAGLSLLVAEWVVRDDQPGT